MKKYLLLSAFFALSLSLQAQVLIGQKATADTLKDVTGNYFMFGAAASGKPLFRAGGGKTIDLTPGTAPFKDLRDFGAIAGDNLDDSPAFQAAFNSAFNLSIPAGEFIVNSVTVPYAARSKKVLGAGSYHYDRTKGTVLKSTQAQAMFIFQNGADGLRFEGIRFDGVGVGTHGINGTFGSFLELHSCGFYNFTQFGFMSRQGLARITNCFFGGSTVGAEIYSDAAISNSEFTGGGVPLRLVAGGNRLNNVWVNGGSETCLELIPLDATTNHINTSLSNVYIGEVYSVSGTKPAVRMLGTVAQKVQNVQMSNSFIVTAAGEVSAVNGGIFMDYVSGASFSNIEFRGKGTDATATAYTDYFLKMTNSTEIKITGCGLNVSNKQAVQIGAGCVNVALIGNVFSNCSASIATADEGANIYNTGGLRVSITGNMFINTNSNSVPYAYYADTETIKTWSTFADNTIAYPNAAIVKTAAGVTTFSGNYKRVGSAQQYTANEGPVSQWTNDAGYLTGSAGVTSGYVPKATAAGVLANSLIYTETNKLRLTGQATYKMGGYGYGGAIEFRSDAATSGADLRSLRLGWWDNVDVFTPILTIPSETGSIIATRTVSGVTATAPEHLVTKSQMDAADATKVGLTGAETIAGVKTFSSTIVGSVNGNAATVTTNANLTGAVTSSGNATTYNDVVPSAKGGAGTVSGILKANGSGTVSAAVAGDLPSHNHSGTNLVPTSVQTGVGGAGGIGAVRMNEGGPVHTGFFSWHRPNGDRAIFAGYDFDNILSFNLENGATGVRFNGGVVEMDRLGLNPMTQTARDALTPGIGDTVFCSNCTATDASTGVLQVWNGTVWKNTY